MTIASSPTGGFLTENNNPTRAGFASYDAASCTIIARSSGAVLAEPGDTIKLDIGNLRWRYTPNEVVKGASLPPFVQIENRDPATIPQQPAGHTFEVAVRMHLDGQTYLLCSSSEAFKLGLDPLWAKFGRNAVAPVTVALGLGKQSVWVPKTGRFAGQSRPIISPVFNPLDAAPEPVASSSTVRVHHRLDPDEYGTDLAIRAKFAKHGIPARSPTPIEIASSGSPPGLTSSGRARIEAMIEASRAKKAAAAEGVRHG